MACRAVRAPHVHRGAMLLALDAVVLASCTGVSELRDEPSTSEDGAPRHSFHPFQVDSYSLT